MKRGARRCGVWASHLHPLQLCKGTGQGLGRAAAKDGAGIQPQLGPADALHLRLGFRVQDLAGKQSRHTSQNIAAKLLVQPLRIFLPASTESPWQ